MCTWEECVYLKWISGIFSGQSAWEDNLASMESEKVKFVCRMYLSVSAQKRTINVQDPLKPPNLSEETKPNQACPYINIFIRFHFTYKVDSFYQKKITPFLYYCCFLGDAQCDKCKYKFLKSCQISPSCPVSSLQYIIL